MLRNRRRRFASEVTGNRKTVDESELTSENDYEDIELGRAGGSSEWHPPSKPPRRKRSKSTSDFESGSPVDVTTRKSRRDVGTEMGRARPAPSKCDFEGSIIDDKSCYSVSDRIERIQMCPLRLDEEKDVSKTTDFNIELCLSVFKFV